MMPNSKILLSFMGVALVLYAFQSESPEPPPSVRATIRNQYYCLGQPDGPIGLEPLPPDAITMRLRIQLAYRNVAQRPLILPVVSGLTALIVSRTADDAIHGRYELVVPYGGRMTPFELKPEELTEPKRDFEVIPPQSLSKYLSQGEEYAILSVHDPRGRRPELLGRRIFLQLEFDHLRFSRSVARDLAIKWERYGYLWTGTVVTEPIEINIPRSPQFADCSHEYTIDAPARP